MAKPIRYCEVEGCEKRVKGHGLCEVHYMRVLRNDPDQLRELRAQPPAEPSTCSVDECDRPAAHRGFCNMHYLRIYRHGTLELKGRKGRPPVDHPPCIVEGCTRWEGDPHRVHGLCRFHYRSKWFRENYVPVPRKPVADRFWEKVDKRGPDECWEWQAAKSNGYGAFGRFNSTGGNAAHRVSYELLIGPVPTGAHLHHTCRNRACVNPAHLEPIMPDVHQITTWADTLRAMGYTVTEPDDH